MARAAVVLLLVLLPLFVCAAETGIMRFRHGKHHRRSARSVSCKQSCFRAGTDCFSLKAKAKSCFTCEQRPGKLSWNDTPECPTAMCELVQQEFTEAPISGDPAKLMPFCEGVKYAKKREQLSKKAKVDDVDSGGPGGSGGSHDTNQNDDDDIDDNTINVPRDVDPSTGAGIIVFPKRLCDFIGNTDNVDDDDTCQEALDGLVEEMKVIIKELPKKSVHLCLHGYTNFAANDEFIPTPEGLELEMLDKSNDIGRLFYTYPTSAESPLCQENDKSEKRPVTGAELAHSRMCVFRQDLYELQHLLGGQVTLVPHYLSGYMRVVVEFSRGPCA